MIRFRGDEELEKKLRRYPSALDREMKRAATQGAIIVQGEMKKSFRKGGYRRRANKRLKATTSRLRKRVRRSGTVNSRALTAFTGMGFISGGGGSGTSTARAVGRLGRRSVRVPVPPPRWPMVYRRTGFASRSLNHRVVKGSGATAWDAYVGGWAPYLRRLEEGFHGTDKRGRRYNQKARKFMRRSLFRRQREIDSIFEDAPAAARRRLDL